MVSRLRVLRAAWFRPARYRLDAHLADDVGFEVYSIR
jgi:hypothetical protein